MGDLTHRTPKERAQLEEMMDKYYSYHGWTNDGRPTQEVLERIGLDDYWPITVADGHILRTSEETRGRRGRDVDAVAVT
jgi:hypothetical protein